MSEQSSLIVVCGIVITYISANTPLVIDGELGIITHGGVNKFLESTLIDFPLLYPGENTITCSNSQAQILVSYTPIFV